MKKSTQACMRSAKVSGYVIPAFNIPYLPMLQPIVRALRDTNAFGLIQVARLEWEKFESGSLKAVRDEYERTKDEAHTRLHLDHVPVIDEDDQRVDYQSIIQEAIDLGYESVMVDASRLPLAENIAAAQDVARRAHAAGIPFEAELGAILGHEAGPLPPYDELFRSGKGFTDIAEARRFVDETAVDWLSIAIGSIHGAISGAAKSQKKIAARLDIAHLDALREATDIPLVLHGGTGIPPATLRVAFEHGITKINIATAVRQPYEQTQDQSLAARQQAVYDTTTALIRDELGIAGSAPVLLAP